jgi:monoamine oxidase
MIDPCKPEPNVVIIGAGMAGLSAAHRLAQCGFRNFTVLEATDRYFAYKLRN